MALRRNKPWHQNASNLLVVNSILAAIAAITVQTLATDHPRPNVIWLLSGLAAMFMFIISAEKITEAFSGDDVRLYAKFHLPYNLAVLLLFADVVGLVRHYAALSNRWALVTAAVCFIAWLWGWGCDTLFLMFASRSEYQKWIDQLEGKKISGDVQDPCGTLLSWLRGLSRIFSRHKRLPHEGVYTRLQSSRVHGVGVFAIRDIKKGTRLFADADDELVWCDGKDVVNLPSDIKALYEDFAIIKDGDYGCPTSFNRLTMGWYLNDSDHPNVDVDDDYEMSAARDIIVGEELTIDSSKFSEQPYKKSDRENA